MIRIALLFAVLAAPAVACPVAADLANGIRFTDAEGVTETFSADAPGLVTSLYDFKGRQTRSVLLNGLYLVRIEELADGAPVPGSGVLMGFTDPPGGRSEPDRGSGFATTLTTIDGDRTSSETMAVSFGPAAPLTIGACTYAAIPVRFDYPGRKPKGHEIMTYLRDLGLAYMSAAGKDGAQDVRFTYVSVEALP